MDGNVCNCIQMENVCIWYIDSCDGRHHMISLYDHTSNWPNNSLPITVQWILFIYCHVFHIKCVYSKTNDKLANASDSLISIIFYYALWCYDNYRLLSQISLSTFRSINITIDTRNKLSETRALTLLLLRTEILWYCSEIK